MEFPIDRLSEYLKLATALGLREGCYNFQLAVKPTGKTVITLEIRGSEKAFQWAVENGTRHGNNYMVAVDGALILVFPKGSLPSTMQDDGTRVIPQNFKNPAQSSGKTQSACNPTPQETKEGLMGLWDSARGLSNMFPR